MLLVYFLLPTLLGTVLAWRLVPLSGPGRWTLWLGLGLAFGMALAAGSIWLLDLLGWPFARTALAGMLAMLGLAVLLLVYLSVRFLRGKGAWPAATDASSAQAGNPPWARWLVWGLAVLVVLRFISVLPDALMRPVFPWDAWKLWAWIARVWFETGELVLLLPQSDWLHAAGDEYVRDGVHHPTFVPLLMLYPAVVVGAWDDSLIGVAWLVAGLSSVMIVHGLLRHLGVAQWISWLGIYLLVSAPLFATHIALFGYADLWVMLYMLVFGLGLMLWVRHRGWQSLLVMLFAGVMMSLAKDTGVYWVPVLLLAWLATLMSNRQLILVLAVAGGLAGLLWLVGVDPLLWLSSDRYSLEARISAEGVMGIAHHLFVRQDWHLAWYLLPLVFALAIWRAGAAPELRGLLVLSVLATAYALAGFVLTRAAVYAADGTLFSRIVLQLYPVLVLLGVLVLWQFLRDWQPGSQP
ncbi:hypothetical protein IC757_06715 [Wenzhouxiangella sp. AB-CW3]|uniref:hypothetical protein n=1 Tax=Wenzhouxiangella sp. AB-CW3 TaxID=2771012 RepID=UPI00168B02B3|nr:hypothetical protein [Wenzhouxiangella sp. AB-CW3]QOC23811.1 hypothetical protein IC757_06715 [Wenzhouxiangella sp. AB-CW3]